MTDTAVDPRPSHQSIEEAFKPARKIIEWLSDGIERREADRLIQAAEQVSHVARDKMRLPPADED
jgi:hypothetical protein